MYTYTKVWIKYILAVVALHAVVAYSRRKMWKGLQEDNLPSADQVWLKEKQNQTKTKIKKGKCTATASTVKTSQQSESPHAAYTVPEDSLKD